MDLSRPPELPEHFGDYRITGLLGTGAMGVVYRAVHSDHGEVALKVIRTDRPIGREAFVRFKREFRALARLDHPGVVRAFDLGNEDGQLYYAMECVNGTELRTQLEEHDFPTLDAPGRLVRIIELFGQITAAMDYVHARGIIHRDLKPSNILVTLDGRAKVSDFGLAREADRFGTRLTRSGLLLGTAAYMAPEQVSGRKDVDARADLYALGVMLYEALCGHLPFEEESGPALLQAHLAVPPPDPRQELPDLPPELVTIVMSLLAKSPGDRPATGRAVHRALMNVPLPRKSGHVQEDTWTGAELFAEPTEHIFRSALVGREKELGVLQARVEDLRAGKGGVLLIRGEAGIGKSRLAAECVELARWEGARAFTGTHKGEGSLGALSEILGRISRSLTRISDTACREILGGHGKVIGQVFPAFLDLPGTADLPDPYPLEPKDAQARLVDSLDAVLRAFAGLHPVVIVIEDIQWAGRETLSLIEQLARSRTVEHQDGTSDAAPLLTIATLRSGERSSDFDKAIEGMTSLAAVDLLEPACLSSDGLATMLASIVGHGRMDPSVADYVFRISGGNPFFTEELLRGALLSKRLIEDPTTGDLVFSGDLESVPLPQTLATVLERRLEGLDDDALGLLRITALCHTPPSFDILEALVNVDEDLLLDTIDDLVKRELLEDHPAGFRFRHALLGQAVRDGLGSSRAQRLHRRLGRSLAELPSFPDQDACVGRHLRDAGLAEEALPHLLRAGEIALERGRFMDALRLFRDSNDIGRIDLEPLARLARLEAQFGEPEQSRQAFEDLRQQSEADADMAAAALLGLAHLELQTADHASAREHLEEARTALEGLDDPVRLSETLRMLGDLETAQGNYDEALPHLEEAAQLSRSTEAWDRLGASLRSLGRLHRYQGAVKKALPLYREALEKARTTGETRALAHSRSELGQMLLISGQLKEAEDHLEKALYAYRSQGNLTAACMTLYALCHLAILVGDLDAARDRLDRGLAIARDRGLRSMVHRFLGAAGGLHLESGRLSQALAAFDEGRSEAEALGFEDGIAGCLIGRCEIQVLRGAWEQSIEGLEEVMDRYRRLSRMDGISLAHALTARAQVSQGKCAPALEQAEIGLKIAVDADLPATQAQESLARVLTHMGRFADARKVLEEALDGLDVVPRDRIGVLVERVLLEVRVGGWNAALASAQEVEQVPGAECRPTVGLVRGLLEQALGDDVSAGGHLEETRRGAKGEPPVEVAAAVALVEVRAAQGRAEEARQVLDDICDGEGRADWLNQTPPLQSAVRLAEAHILLAEKRLDEATEAAQEARRLAGEDPVALAKASLALARSQQGNLDAAQAALDAALEAECPPLVWRAHLAMAEAAETAGEDTSASIRAAAEGFAQQAEAIPSEGSHRNSFTTAPDAKRLRAFVEKLRNA